MLKWRKRGFHGNPIVDARFSNSKECVGASPTLSTMSKRYSARLATFFKKVVVVKKSST
jgi:hypothetical protein